MGAVAEVISAPFEAVGEVVGAAAEFIGSAAQEVGNFVEDTAQAVGKTVEAIAQDPVKAIPLIVVAVVAPELAPLLWEGASVAEAAMLLNTASSLAQGADPLQVAQNIGTSLVTQGITANLPVDLSTGSSFADQAIANTAAAAAQGRDPAQALGSMIGGAIVRGGVNEVAGGISDFAGLDDRTAPVVDRSEPYTQTDQVTASQTFRDAIENGFSPEEAYAIAQGQMDAEQSGPSPYAPTASTTTSDQPQPSVTVTGADNVEGEGLSLPSPSKEQLDQDLADGNITQEEYDRMSPTAGEAKALQEYVDPYKEFSPIDATGEDFDMSAPIPEPQEIVSDGLTNQKIDQSGNQVYTYDDGSTLTVSPTGDVVDFSEATDFGGLDSLEGTGEYQEEEYTETPDETSGSGFSVKFGLPRTSRAAAARRGLSKKPTLGAGETAADPGLLLNAQYGSQLTSNVLTGDPNYNLIGSIAEQEPQEMAAGGSPDTQGIYDLSYTASSPFLSSGASIMALKPGLVKPKNLNYELAGYPFGKEWKAAKEGGPIGHNPEFFSEGGLNSLKNSYVKGKGDGTSDSIPAMLANGEFVIPADVVSSLGNGSNDSGAEILSEFLKTIREHKRKADSRKLPPDSKGALGYLTEAKKKVKK